MSVAALVLILPLLQSIPPGPTAEMRAFTDWRALERSIVEQLLVEDLDTLH